LHVNKQYTFILQEDVNAIFNYSIISLRQTIALLKLFIQTLKSHWNTNKHTDYYRLLQIILINIRIVQWKRREMVH